MKRNNTFIRRRKRLNALKLFGVLVVVSVVGVWFGFYWQAVLITLVFYLVNDAFFSDASFYLVRSDYVYPFIGEQAISSSFENNVLTISAEEPFQTAFLECHVHSSIIGYVRDPFIEISAPGKSIKQYFELGCRGRRYINLSCFSDLFEKGAASLSIRSHHCQIRSPKVLSFTHDDYRTKNVLIIAPHADDAELAAFGLYKNTAKVNIVTITAGETETEAFETLTGDAVWASKLKGRLRALDSISGALWAGKRIEQHVNLGYFCQQLESMAKSPEDTIDSRCGGLDSPQIFRRFNQTPQPLKAPRACWNNLVEDIVQLIDLWRPDVIVTPHPQIDPHEDHVFSSVALNEAVGLANHKPERVLLYANHYHHSQYHPAGPALSSASIPPVFADDGLIKSQVHCFVLDDETLIDKYCAVELMHDLRRPRSFKKRFRRAVKQLLLQREPLPFGEDDYLRKAVRREEIFFMLPTDDFASLCDEVKRNRGL